MMVIAFLLVLLCAAGAFLAAPRCAACLRWGLALVSVVAVVCLYILYWAPRDYMLRFPATATVLHPYRVAGYAGLAVVIGLGILLGMTVRVLHAGWRRTHGRKPGSPEGERRP